MSFWKRLAAAWTAAALIVASPGGCWQALAQTRPIVEGLPDAAPVHGSLGAPEAPLCLPREAGVTTPAGRVGVEASNNLAAEPLSVDVSRPLSNPTQASSDRVLALERVSPRELKLLSRVPNGKWNVFRGVYRGRPVFAKLDAMSEEILSHIRAAALDLPDNLVVPAPLAAGEEGLRELPQVEGAQYLPDTSIRFYAAKGGRIFVMASAPADAKSAASLAEGRSTLAAPLSAADAAGLARAIDAIHESGAVHGDLRGENVLVSQDGARTRFHLIDWEHAGRASAGVVREEKAFAARLIERLLGRGGSPHSVVPPAGEDPEAPRPPPAGSKLLRGAALAGIVGALAVVPSLVHAAPVWAGAGPHGFDLAPFALPSHPLGLAALGAGLGVLDYHLAKAVQRLHNWTRSGPVAAPVERLNKRSMANPLFVGELGLAAFCEELAYRLLAYSMFSGWLAPVVPAWAVYPASALAVAALFSFSHRYGGVWARVVGSLVYSAAYLATGALWLPIAVHFFHNLYWFIANRR